MLQMRVCRLGDFNIWRVEQLQRPRWPLSLFREPRWHVVYRLSMFCEPVPAEYVSESDAAAAMASFIKWDQINEARAANKWCNGGR